jgi:hypothetical protein
VETRLLALFRAQPTLEWVPGVYERCFGRTLAATYGGKLYVDALRAAATAPQQVALFGPMQLDFGVAAPRLCYGVEHKTVAELLADVNKWLAPPSSTEAITNEAAVATASAPARFFFKAAPTTPEGVPVWTVQRIDPQAAIVI